MLVTAIEVGASGFLSGSLSAKLGAHANLEALSIAIRHGLLSGR